MNRGEGMSEQLQPEDYNGRMVIWPEGWAWTEKYHDSIMKNGDSYDTCIHCGRKVSSKGQAVGVLISEGGGAFILPTDYETYPHDGGEMGWFPVGRECIKAIPKAYRVEDPKHR
jgi:hypothetical protein